MGDIMIFAQNDIFAVSVNYRLEGQINSLTKYLAVSAYTKFGKLLFRKLINSLGEYYQYEWKSTTQKRQQINNKIHIITGTAHQENRKRKRKITNIREY